MNQENLYKLILAPHMSEKAAMAMENNGHYVFQVRCDATKPDVKQAIELLFNTKVESVRILNVKRKPKRFGKVEGYSKAWKKAYVKLEQGQKIDFGGSQ